EQEMLLYSRCRSEARAVAVWRRHPRTVVLKLGARGSRLIAPDLDISARPPRVKAVDTTGAGDAFNGGFLYALLRGLPPRACLAAGNFAGAMSTRAAGGLDALPRARDLPAALRRVRPAARGRR